SGLIRVYFFPTRKSPSSLHIAYGTRLTVRLSGLREPRNFLTPDAFDWESYLHRQGIYFTGRVRGPEDLTVLPGRSGSGVRALVYNMRGRLLANLDRLYSADPGNSEGAAILRAMLLGDDNWLSPQIENAFQSSGTYHVLVVSGWNVFAFAIP